MSSRVLYINGNLFLKVFRFSHCYDLMCKKVHVHFVKNSRNTVGVLACYRGKIARKSGKMLKISQNVNFDMNLLVTNFQINWI